MVPERSSKREMAVPVRLKRLDHVHPRIMLSTVPYTNNKIQNRVSQIFSKYQLLFIVNYLSYFSPFPLEYGGWQFQNKKYLGLPPSFTYICKDSTNSEIL
jgi:hypothetical protein